MLYVKEASGEYQTADLPTIAEAYQAALSRRYRRGVQMTAPGVAVDYLRPRLAHLDHEVFLVLFLDAQNRLISCDQMASGGLTSAAVYPRTIAQRALTHNAAAVILAHNHPSGDPTPSMADDQITAKIREVLALVDVRTLDHVIIAGLEHYSYTQEGAL